MSQDLVARAQAFYAAAMSDPVAATEEYLSDDFALVNRLPEAFPFGGVYEGRAGFLQYLGEITTALEMGPLAFDEWIRDGQTVVARGSENSLVKATGRRYCMSFVHWLEFDDDGRIRRMTEYNDTAAMALAFPSEAAG